MSRKAAKLRERMQQSCAGWSYDDLVKLYLGFGFTIRISKSGHDVVKHPDHPHLRASVPRHGELAKTYCKTALKLVEKALELTQGEEGQS